MSEGKTEDSVDSTVNARDDLLLRFLERAEAPCPICGYNLHKLTRPKCPECGQTIELRVGAVNARISALIACLTPMLMMFGLSVFFGAMTMKHGLPRGRGESWFYMMLIGGLINGAVSARVYQQRVWFLCLGSSTQNRFVLLAWLVNAIVFLSVVFGS